MARSPADLLALGRPLTLAGVADGAEGLVTADLVVQGATPTQLRNDASTVLRRLEQTYLRNAGRGMPRGVRLIEPPSPAGDA